MVSRHFETFLVSDGCLLNIAKQSHEYEHKRQEYFLKWRLFVTKTNVRLFSCYNAIFIIESADPSQSHSLDIFVYWSLCHVSIRLVTLSNMFWHMSQGSHAYPKEILGTIWKRAVHPLEAESQAKKSWTKVLCWQLHLPLNSGQTRICWIWEKTLTAII